MGLLHLYVHVEMYAQCKIHSAFSHVGKANTCEPSLAPVHLSMHATIGSLNMPSGIKIVKHWIRPQLEKALTCITFQRHIEGVPQVVDVGFSLLLSNAIIRPCPWDHSNATMPHGINQENVHQILGLQVLA